MVAECFKQKTIKTSTSHQQKRLFHKNSERESEVRGLNVHLHWIQHERTRCRK